jgi:hypothetical protein
LRRNPDLHLLDVESDSLSAGSDASHLGRGIYCIVLCASFKFNVHNYPIILKDVPIKEDVEFYFCLQNAEDGIYRGADKSLARPGRKQTNVAVRMA